jgi:hypothetical protein
MNLRSMNLPESSARVRNRFVCPALHRLMRESVAKPAPIPFGVPNTSVATTKAGAVGASATAGSKIVTAAPDCRPPSTQPLLRRKSQLAVLLCRPGSGSRVPQWRGNDRSEGIPARQDIDGLDLPIAEMAWQTSLMMTVLLSIPDWVSRRPNVRLEPRAAAEE